MARYYLHLRDDVDDVVDPEGVEFANLKAVKDAVLKAARDLMSADMKLDGTMDLGFRIDAENEDGDIVASLPFKSAFSLVRAAA
jgi:hypothetical protein